MRDQNAYEKGPQGYVAQTQSWQTSDARERRMSSHWLEIRVMFSAQSLALVKARHKMVTSLQAIKRSLGLFPGMEALVSALSHTASFQVTSGHTQTTFGNAPSFRRIPKLPGNTLAGWARATGTVGSTPWQVTTLLCPGRCLVSVLLVGTSRRINLD